MQTLEQLRRRVDSAKDLQSVVKTMKALAAVGMRQYEQAAESLADYDRTVTRGLQALLQDIRTMPLTDQDQTDASYTAHILVVFGSDQGMCGQLNDQVTDHLEQTFPQQIQNSLILASGMRLAELLRHTGPSLWANFNTPNSIDTIADASAHLLDSIQHARTETDLRDVYLIFPRRTSAASYEIHTRRILPLDRRWVQGLHDKPWPSRSIPTWPVSRRAVLSAFINEYLFVSLCRALVDTLASEHASRMSSMQSAERNIEDRIDELETQYRHQRQTSITSELMDIVSGFEALSDEESQQS